MRGFCRVAVGGVCLVFLIANTPASAQDAGSDVGEVVFGAGRTPIVADRLGRATTVVTAEDIENRGVTYAADALRFVPGVAVSRAGAPGGLTQIRIRGAEANHVLVLIDGVEVSSPAGGEYDFGGLLAADIERIEVLRGPQSALYGSNATAGVINIRTKRATKKGVTFGGSAEGGTDETAAGSAHVRAAGDKARFSLSGAYRRAGGHDVSGDATDVKDRDRNATVNARVGATPVDWLGLDASFRLTDRDSDFDGFAFGAPDRKALVVEEDSRNSQRDIFASAGATADAFDGRLVTVGRVDFARVDTVNTIAGAKASDTTGDRFRLSLQSTYAIDAPTVAAADHKLTLATDFERETFVNNDAALVFDPSQLDTQSRTLYGFAAEYQGAFFDSLDVQLALRHDRNDSFEDATTYSASVSYLFERTASRFHASVGTGVTIASFFEQFGFMPATFEGNAGLEPEENFGWDIGLEQTLWCEKLVIDVTYFNARLKNEIATVFGAVTTVENEDGVSKREGVEVTLRFRPTAAFSVKGGYTYTDAKDPDGKIETRRPRHKFSLAGDYIFLGGRARIGADARYVLDNFDLDFTAPSFGGERIKLDDYLLLNLTAAYAISDSVTLKARVENALDTRYQEVDGYETPGVAGYLGLGVKF